MRCSATSNFLRTFVALVIAGASGGCAPADGAHPTTSPDAGAPAGAALAQVQALARPDPTVDRMLAPTADGWTLDGDAFASPGLRAGPEGALAARLARTADGVLEVSAARRVPHRLELRAQGAAPGSVGVLNEGRVTFENAYPATDLVVVTSPGRVEQLLLLRDASAPRRFAWTVTRGPGLVEVRQTPSEGIRFLDEKGEGVLRVLPAFALDRAGTRRDARLAFAGDQLALELDTEGLEFPVLLDPAIESYLWELMATGPTELATRLAPLAFDNRAGRNVTVLFGGQYGGAVKRDDTWEWNGTTWTQRCGPTMAPCGPPARSKHSLAFHDGATKGVLLFGGEGGFVGDFGDTWQWDGNAWAQLCATCTASAAPFRPARRNSSSLAHHTGYGTVLFGGYGGEFASGVLGDTWVWDGSTWTAKCTACGAGTTMPSPRFGHAMAYDAAHGKTVLFGGYDNVTRNSETWLWDSTTETWTQACVGCVAGTTKPAARSNFGMAYDSRRGKVVLFGGCCNGTSPTDQFDDTWEWNGTVWTKVAPPVIAGRHTVGMTFDSNRGRTVMFGGYKYNLGGPNGETWEYHAFGGACSSGTQCDTGYCVDGVCCESSSCPVCQSCDLGTGTGPGKCNPIVNAEDPSGCSGTQRCDATSACKLKEGQSCTAGTQCATGSCVDGTCCSQSTLCNSAPGACLSCANAAGTCTTQIKSQDDDWCNGTNTCDANGVCKKKTGQSCVGGTECASGNCADGTCCADACTTPCRSCANPAGTCTTVISNGEDGTACSGINSCDGSGNCKKKNGQSCSAGSECVSGNCADSYCCDSACSGGCDVCASALGASQNGACTVLGAGSAGQCGAYKCGGSAACPTTCSSDAQCANGHYCDGNACQPKKALGATCSNASQCSSTYCADGVCCNTACTGKCMACSAGNKQDSSPANSGTCNAAKQGTNPGSQCVVSTDPCGEQDSCSGTPGQCALGASGKSCGPTTCLNGNVTGKICNGAGLCTDQTNVACAPYVCKGSACSSPCTADTDCEANHYCATGVCVAKADNGKGCSAANACKSSFCADGVCCDSPCTGQCQACAESGSIGQCKVVSGKPREPRPDCLGTAGDKCKGACDGSSPNSCTYLAAGTACKDAACTGDVSQPAGACDGVGSCALPATKNCAPYGCGAATGTCKSSCASNPDCSQGATCDTSTGQCTTGSATCVDATTVKLANGQTESCAPYKCVAGACQQQCASPNDCASGYVCVGSACVTQDAGSDSGSGGSGGSGGSSTGGSATGGTKSSGAADDGGCGCRVPAHERGSGAQWLVALALAAAFHRRARARHAA